MHINGRGAARRCNARKEAFAVFESPLDWCPLCREWIALDQTFAECAQRYGCKAETCPLARRLMPATDPRADKDLDISPALS
jgi:hypothetical protein